MLLALVSNWMTNFKAPNLFGFWKDCGRTNLQNQVQCAKCGVQLLSAEIFSVVQEHSPSEKPFAIRYSPFAGIFSKHCPKLSTPH